MNADQQAALVNSLRGPVMLITIGVLFLIQRFTPYGLSETWPVILIVVGLLHLAGATRRNDIGRPGNPTAGGSR